MALTLGPRGRPLLPILLAILAFSGCAAAEPRALGTITYRASGERGASTVRLTTEPIEGRVSRTPPDLRAKQSEVETELRPEEMGALLESLEEDGLFALPGREAVPADPAPRSIAVDTDARRFYVTLPELEDARQIDVYAKAARKIIVASQVGPHYGLPK